RIPSSAIVMAGLASLAGAAALELSAFHLQTRLTLSVTRDTELWYPMGPRRTTGNDGECRTTSEHTETNGTDIRAFLRKNCASEHMERQLYVAGDLHAEAYLSLLAKLSEEKGVPIFIYTQPGCAFLSLYSPMSKAPERCRNFVQATVRDIEQRAK